MVGYAPISILQKLAVTSCSSDRPFLYFHHIIDCRAFSFYLSGAFNPHTKWRAVWLRPLHTQLSTEFYKVMGYAATLQVVCKYVHTIPLRNPVHVQFHTRQLYQPPAPELDFIHAHTIPYPIHSSAIGKLVLRFDPKPPKLYQGTNRDIK